MHGANHYYGHAHIMATYAGLQRPLTILGYLQHGWNILDGYAVGTSFIPGSPLFVWSPGVARRGWSMGRRAYAVIGAAWCYLLSLEAGSTPGSQDREGTIFYPFHGWEGQQVIGDHQRMLDQLRDVEDGPLTVCLYWNEYELPEVREVYERAGCRVVTHGLRGFNYVGTDTRFLYKQLAEMRRHRRVVSNRLSSAILYGASVGCSVGVYGDPMLLEDEHPAFGGVERLHRLWPEMHEAYVDADVAAACAHQELGMDQVVSPAEVRSLFRWPEPQEVRRA